MEKYNKLIAENAKVEMIHLSLDSSEDAAKAWAVKENFPWYTILNDDLKRSGLAGYKITKYVPEYALLSADGTRVGSGGGVFEQAAKLTK